MASRSSRSSQGHTLPARSARRHDDGGETQPSPPRRPAHGPTPRPLPVSRGEADDNKGPKTTARKPFRRPAPIITNPNPKRLRSFHLPALRVDGDRNAINKSNKSNNNTNNSSVKEVKLKDFSTNDKKPEKNSEKISEKIVEKKVVKAVSSNHTVEPPEKKGEAKQEKKGQKRPIDEIVDKNTYNSGWQVKKQKKSK